MTQKEINERLEAKINRLENALADLAYSSGTIEAKDSKKVLRKYRIVGGN